MSPRLPEENLLLLTTQPRAGSTRLPRILGRHRQFHTTAGPWMVPDPVYEQRALDPGPGWLGRVLLVAVEFLQERRPLLDGRQVARLLAGRY